MRLPVKDKAGVDHMLAPRRHVLDRVLADAAIRAGATLLDRDDRRRHPARRRRPGPWRHGHRRGRDPRCSSPHASWSAPTASGHGWRGLVGAEVVESHAPSGACLYTYVGDQAWDGFEFHLGDHAFAGVFPTHFGEACVWLIRPGAPRAGPCCRPGAHRLEAWTEALDSTVPGLAERVRRGHGDRAPARVPSRLPNHVRRAAGPGWALVGDAGYHRDPITGTRHDRRLPRRGPARGGGRPRAARPVPRRPQRCATSSGERDRALAETFRLTRALGAFPPTDGFVELQGELGRALDTEAQELAARDAATPTCRCPEHRRPPTPLVTAAPHHAPPHQGELTVHNTMERRPNGVDVDTLFATIDAVRQQPEAARFRFRADNEWVSGTHSRGRFPGFFGAGQEHVHAVPGAARSSSRPTTRPCSSAPTRARPRPSCSSTPSPSCLMAGLGNIAAARGVELRGVTCRVEGDIDLRGILGIDPTVRNGFSDITSCSTSTATRTPTAVAALVAQSQARSAVFDVLTHGTRVDVEVARR